MKWISNQLWRTNYVDLDQLGQFPTRIKHARLHGRLADANDFGNLFDRLRARPELQRGSVQRAMNDYLNALCGRPLN